MVGPFLPIIRVPFLGTFNYLGMSTLKGLGPSIPWFVFVFTFIGVGVATLTVTVGRNFRLLVLPAAVVTGVLGFTAYRFYALLDKDVPGQLDLGFGLLAIAAVLMIAAAVVPARRGRKPQDARSA
jgi:hypothetical protein